MIVWMDEAWSGRWYRDLVRVLINCKKHYVCNERFQLAEENHEKYLSIYTIIYSKFNEECHILNIISN